MIPMRRHAECWVWYLDALVGRPRLLFVGCSRSDSTYSARSAMWTNRRDPIKTVLIGKLLFTKRFLAVCWDIPTDSAAVMKGIKTWPLKRVSKICSVVLTVVCIMFSDRRTGGCDWYMHNPFAGYFPLNENARVLNFNSIGNVSRFPEHAILPLPTQLRGTPCTFLTATHSRPRRIHLFSSHHSTNLLEKLASAIRLHSKPGVLLLLQQGASLPCVWMKGLTQNTPTRWGKINIPKDTISCKQLNGQIWSNRPRKFQYSKSIIKYT